MVSGAILCGVVVMSFQVMVTSAKLSTAPLDTSSTIQVAQTGMHQITSEIQDANFAYGRKSVGGVMLVSGPEELALRSPVRDMAGRLVPDEFKVVRFFLKETPGFNAPNTLFQETKHYRGSSVVGSLTEPVIVNVGALKFDYDGVVNSLPHTNGEVRLPFAASTETPRATTVKVSKVMVKGEEFAVAAARGDDDDDDRWNWRRRPKTTSSGSRSTVTVQGDRMTFNKALAPEDRVDVEYQLDPGHAANADGANSATLITVTVELAKKGKADRDFRSTVQTTTFMRNAAK